MLANRVADFCRHGLDRSVVFPLEHHADERFGPRVSNQEPPAPIETPLDRAHGFGHRRDRPEIDAFTDSALQQDDMTMLLLKVDDFGTRPEAS